MKKIICIFTMILVTSPVIAIGDSLIELDVRPTTMNFSSGTIPFILSNTTTELYLDKITYRPSDLIHGSLRIRTNQTVLFGDPEYSVEIFYRPHYKENDVTKTSGVKIFKNDSTRYYLDELNTINFESSIHISLLISPGVLTSDKILLHIKYNFEVIDVKDQLSLDEFQEYQLTTISYPDEFVLPATQMFNSMDDVKILMPQLRALNETNLGVNGSDYDYFYSMHVYLEVRDIVSIDTYTTSLQLEAGFEGARSNKERVTKTGTYVFHLSNITNTRVTHIELEHTGAQLNITIKKINLFVPAMLNVPLDLLMDPTLQVVSTGVALVLTILGYKIVAIFGEKKVKSKLELI